MRVSARWAGIALGAVLVTGFLWETRYEAHGCTLSGCIVIDRWTGAVGYRLSASEYKKLQQDFGEEGAEYAEAFFAGKRTGPRPQQLTRKIDPLPRPERRCAPGDTEEGWGGFEQYLRPAP